MKKFKLTWEENSNVKTKIESIYCFKRCDWRQR